jgi:hypothetical protein
LLQGSSAILTLGGSGGGCAALEEPRYREEHMTWGGFVALTILWGPGFIIEYVRHRRRKK